MTELHRIVTGLLFALPALGAPCLASDLLVGPAGSGAPFSDLQAAIDQAMPGDRVLVQAGNYQGPVLVTRGIEVLGSGPASTVLESSNVTFNTPTFEVRDLPADEQVRLSGFKFVDASVPFIQPSHAVLISSCAGRVSIDHLDIDVKNLDIFYSGRLRVVDSEQVWLQEVDIVQNPSGLGTLIIESSSVTAVRCGFGWAHNTIYPTTGIYADSSTLRLEDCQSDGVGDYFNPFSLGELFTAAAPGIGCVDSQLVLTGRETVIRGGSASDETAPWGGTSPSASAIALGSGSSLILAPDVTLIGGAASSVEPASGPISAAPGAVVETLAVPAPTRTITPSLVPLGATATLSLRGEPNALILQAIALAPDFSTDLPGILGALELSAASLVVLPGSVQLDAAGASDASVQLPSAPSLSGLAFYGQALQIAGGDLQLSAPDVLAFLP